MSNSYRTLIERLRQFADGHYIIQKFYHGQIDAADLDKEPRYPMMHVLPVDIRASEGTLDYALEIRFADIGRDKEIKTDYQKEIISDMSRLALSLISEIENGQVLFGEDAEIVDKQATIIPFIEEFTHVLTGVQLNVTIRLPFNWSACDIPADYSPNINDNPTTGSGILTKIGVYNDGDFVGYTSFLDFSDDFTATVVDNKIQIVFNGTAGGAGTLQETTDNGNTTTNDIELIDAAEVKFGTGGGVLLDNGSRLREGTIDANTGGSKGIAQICGVGYELKWEAGSQYVMNGNGDTIRIVNHKFNIAPAATDDSSSGFYVGSRWILDNGDIYVCTDSTIGAAVWEIETYADWNATSGSREIANKPDLSGYGDMFKSTYDTDNDGIVDKSETVQIIVRNSTGSTLTKGQVVYLSGATGNRPNAVLAQANTEATSSKTIGIVVADIANNADGNVAVSGTLHDLNTNSFAAGDAVWLSATTAGAITVTPPAEPNHTVFIGYIARAHPTQGRIVIAIQNGYELNELHGVTVSSPTNNQGLIYNSTSGLWENKNIPNVDLSLISVTSTNAREDNWSPTGWSASTIKVIDFTPNNTNNIVSLGGLANPSAGKIVTIVNSSTNNLVIIENEATTSTAANRFKLAQKSPYFLMPEREITFLYTGTRWSQFNTHPNQGGFDFYDDFENLNPTAGSQATKMFYGVVGAGSTGAGLLSSADTSTAWGVMLLTAGTTATGFLYASVDYRRTGASSIFGVNGLCPQLWVTKTKIVTLPTVAQDFNFNAGLNCASSLVSGGQFGLMWEMPTFASGGVTPAFWNIRITNSVGALTILTATSVPITANTYIYLGIFSTSTNGDAIFFYSTDGITYSFAYRFTRVTGNYGGLPFYRLAGTVGTSNFRTASVDWCGESFNLIR
jgi:hypothetical protein